MTQRHERAIRALARLAGYSASARRPASVTLRAHERVIGAYRPARGTEPTVFTDAGVHVHGERGWRFVPYEEIARAELPGKATPAMSLVLRTRHGEGLSIPVRADERTSDAYELLRFFDRIREDDAAVPRRWTHPSIAALTPAGGDPVRQISERARAVVFDAIEAGWSGPPFDPFALSRLRGIEMRPSSEVADARLVPTAQGFRIEYNPNQPAARARYSVAHELAHTLLPDAASAIRNRGKDADEWQLELLCNVAAAELLMPLGSLAARIDEKDLTIKTVIDLRAIYHVSLEAVAIRLARMSASRLAAFAASRVEDSGGSRYVIDYALPSPGWVVPRLEGTVVPINSVVGQVRAVGFTATSLAPEHWGELDAALHVEAVGAPPYPDSLAPRVVGLVWPWDERRLRATGARYVLGSAALPIGSGRRMVVQIVNDTAAAWGGRSFASQVRTAWPTVQEQFKAWAKENGLALGRVHIARVDDSLSVASIVAQHRYRQLTRPGIRYEALERGLEEVALAALEQRASVHMPRIGTGNARGNWDVISALIEESLVARGIDVTVYDFPDADPTRSAEVRRSVQ